MYREGETLMNRRPLRSNDIRERNEKLVLNLIYTHRGISQSEVAQLTSLKPPTVFRIFSELEGRGIIRECSGEKDLSDRKGRKPSFYCVDPGSFYAIGVDFWSVSAAIVVVDFSGAAVYQNVVNFDGEINADEVTDRIEALIGESIRASGIDTERILGIGVGAPGMVDINEGVVLRYPRIEGMKNYNISERLTSAFDLPVFIHNNASVIALAEYRYGATKGEDSLLAVLIRSGVGGAFIHGGRLFVSRNKTAVEIGHMSVDVNGKTCECGAAGCLETYLSEDAILELVRSQIGITSLEELERRLQNDDNQTLTVMREVARLLVHAVYSLSNILNPEAFLVVSRFQGISDFFSQEIRAGLRSTSQTMRNGEARVISRQYDPLIACKGACDLVYDHFFAQAT